MAEKKNAPHDLQQTNGQFQFRGIVSGTAKDSFYKEITTKSNKPMRMVNFGVEFDKDKRVYVGLNGMERDNVYFSKRVEKDGKTTTEMKTIPWKDRFNFNEEGYSLLGINLGLEKEVDDKGKEVNKKEKLTEFDACNSIGTNLEDGQSIFTKGKIEYSTYKEKHQSKFVPQQISLCSSDIDFEDEKFEPINKFSQQIVFMGVAPDKDNKDRFIISAKIIGYSSIEDFEFVTYNKSMAKKLKSVLKPYNAITLYGTVEAVTSVEETVVEDDGWGDASAKTSMEYVSSPFSLEFKVDYADPDSIDTELYTEESVEGAIAKLNAKNKAQSEFSGKDSDDDWGSVDSKDANEDDEEWT